MSYTIYKINRSGKTLFMENLNYIEAEYLRSCCKNIVIEDSANSMPSDIDTVEPKDYGVASESNMFSASVICACIGLVPVLILLSVIFDA